MNIKYIVLSVLCLCLFSCSNEEEQAEPVVTPQLIVLFSPGGLGDRGYNDLILRGLQEVRYERRDISVLFYSPASEIEAERIFSDWLKRPSSGIPCLFILATSDYVQMADTLLRQNPLTSEYKDVLLFESTEAEQLPVHSFHISMYGASYMAGATAALCPGDKSLVVLGNENDSPIRQAADGFCQGYESEGKTADVVGLSDSWQGFAMEGEAYRCMYDWAKKYQFVYPVAGGSNMGIYRYMREYPQGLYTAGMDVDQSALCSQVVGSLVKHIDRLVKYCVTEWLNTGELPEQRYYDLESGYVDWVLSPDYEEAFAPHMEIIRGMAIKEERRYHEMHL